MFTFAVVMIVICVMSCHAITHSVLENDLGQLARVLVNAESWHVFVKFEVGEALEDLLQGCLRDRVVFKLMLLLQLLNQFEKEAD